MHENTRSFPFMLLIGGASLLAACATPTNQALDSRTVTAAVAKGMANCLGRELCFVALDGGRARWQSVVVPSGEAIALQWIDQRRATFAAPTGATNPLPVTFSEDPGAVSEPAVQFVLSQRVGGIWQDGKLAGGRFVNVDAIDVPAWHEPGNRLLRYEGPAWEMRDVGYRLYLDQRNGTDIFGKQISDLALDDHGRDGDDYHELKAWGADILKVGDSLGIGAPGLRVDDAVHRVSGKDGISARITHQGPHIARMEVASQGWRPGGASAVNVTAAYVIAADSRLTHVTTTTDRPLEGWVTGLVKHDGTELLTSDGTGEWQYLASFGKQSLFDDHLGMAIFYRTSDAQPLTGDPNSYLVAFTGPRAGIDYHMGAWWQADPSGVSSLNQFKDILERERAYLAVRYGPDN